MNKPVLVGLVLALSGGFVGSSVAKGQAIYSATALAHKKQFEAGLIAYRSGDFETALRLWTPLAEQGGAAAQSNLGGLYYKGEGLPQDYAAAASWYRKAADQGLAGAQSFLGQLYYKGEGLPQDYAASASWYRKAADRGNVIAQFNLGSLYERGLGVPQNYVQAHKWYNLAAAGTADIGYRQLTVTNRDDLAAKMTPAQIAEAQRLASEWRKK